MQAGDVTDTREMALAASGLDQVNVVHKPHLLSDNGSSYIAGDLDAQIDEFVGHYNHQRYHESLKNLTPADVYFARGQTILLKRESIKRKTIEHRRLQHTRAAA